MDFYVGFDDVSFYAIWILRRTLHEHCGIVRWRSPLDVDPLKRQCTDDVSNSLLQAMELLRILDREVPAQVLSAFFYIAAHNPCHKQAMEEDLGYTTASGSRCIDMLCDKNRLKKPGYGLVIKEFDAFNKRRLLS